MAWRADATCSFAGYLTLRHEGCASVSRHLLRAARADVVSVPGGAGCAYGGDDLLAVGGRLHRLLARRPVEQAVAEFAFEAVDLGDEDGVLDAEAGCCLAQ
jgi:hypothetical protein